MAHLNHHLRTGTGPVFSAIIEHPVKVKHINTFNNKIIIFQGVKPGVGAAEWASYSLLLAHAVLTRGLSGRAEEIGAV